MGEIADPHWLMPVITVLLGGVFYALVILLATVYVPRLIDRLAAHSKEKKG